MGMLPIWRSSRLFAIGILITIKREIPIKSSRMAITCDPLLKSIQQQHFCTRHIFKLQILIEQKIKEFDFHRILMNWIKKFYLIFQWNNNNNPTLRLFRCQFQQLIQRCQYTSNSNKLGNILIKRTITRNLMSVSHNAIKH